MARPSADRSLPPAAASAPPAVHAASPAGRTDPSPWPWPPALRLSAAGHVAAAVAVAAAPPAWPWALGAVAANHLVLTAAGLWPRSRLLGANLVRLPAAAAARGEVAITFDDGPDAEVTPAVLDLLDALGVAATFFCIADRVRARPALARAILARGHGLENHSRTHSHAFSFLGPRGFDAELRAAQATIADVTGHAPAFFRAPAGLRNPFLGPVLHRHRLALASWTRRGFDTREPRADVVLRRLVRGLGGGDILLLHDGHARRDTTGRPVVLDVLPGLVAACRAAGLRPVTLAQAVNGSTAPSSLDR